jgi:transposase
MEASKKIKKKYLREFKLDTLELLTQGNKTQSQLEADLNLPKGSISRWKREFANEGLVAHRGQGKVRPYDEEMVRLKRENIQLKYERDILKKAMTVVSREDE